MTAADVPDDPVSRNLYHLEASDPRSELIDRSNLDSASIAEINELMVALARLKSAEDQLSEALLRYMKLGQTDMRALHYLIVAENTGTFATPGAIAAHLNISTASTTKLIDRLEKAGHVRRAPHPTDRRALNITITPQTREVAMQSVGKEHAKRFNVATRLSSKERQIVTRFLADMANEISFRDDDWATE